MNSDKVNVAALSGQQVRSLLALGSPATVPQASTADAEELLRQAIDDPTGESLAMLVTDLNRPVLDDDGPMSFRRLTDLRDRESTEMAGKSFSQLLMSRQTSQSALQRLVHYGELLSADTLPRSTRLTGGVMRALAQLALVQRHRFELQAEELKTGRAIVKQLAATDSFNQSLDSDQDTNENEPLTGNQ